MKRAFRSGLPIIAVVGVLIALAALLAVRPWSGGPSVEVEEAVAQPAEFGICNVSVSDIPPGLEVSGLVLPAQIFGDVHEGPFGMAFFLQVSVPLPEGAKRPEPPGPGEIIRSNALIDAQTGKVFGENYKTAADEAAIKPVLARLRVGPWKPAGPAWPRTDTPPTGEIIELPKTVTVAADYLKPTLKYREPEAGSAMSAGYMSFATLPEVVQVYTCESSVEISSTGQVISWEVTPEEEAMFQRFLDEVVAP